MNCARDIFDIVNRGCKAFEETLAVYCTADDADRVERIGNVRATVIIGATANQSAGSPAHLESAASVSVDIRAEEWWSAFKFEPRFGMQFQHQRLGRLVVKSVQRAERDFVCRCTYAQRARER